MRDAALEVGVAAGAQPRDGLAIPAELAEAAHEECAGGAREVRRQAGHQPLLDVLGDPVRARAMGQQGRTKVAATYDSGRLVRDIERLYEDLVRQKL